MGNHGSPPPPRPAPAPPPPTHTHSRQGKTFRAPPPFQIVETFCALVGAKLNVPPPPPPTSRFVAPLPVISDQALIAIRN